MPLHTEWKCLESLKEDEWMYRWDRSSCITKKDCPDICSKCCWCAVLCEAYSVVRYVWFYKPWPLIILCPVKFTTVDDNTTDRCSVSSNELCCWMDYDICTVLDRADKIWCCECIIYYEWYSCLMCDVCDLFDIHYLWVRISECLDLDCFCVFFDSCLDSFIIEWIYECSFDSVIRKCVC